MFKINWQNKQAQVRLKKAVRYRPKGRIYPGRPRRRWKPQKPEQATGLNLKLEDDKKKMICS
jgi:hypothetical protein